MTSQTELVCSPAPEDVLHEMMSLVGVFFCFVLKKSVPDSSPVNAHQPSIEVEQLNTAFFFPLSSFSVSQVTEISMGEFLMHSSVLWLNPLPSLGRMKKEPELTVFGGYPLRAKICVVRTLPFPQFTHDSSQ